MRFLADESCDFSVVRALRTAGYDVLAVCENAPRAEDSQVIQLAVGEGRVLLTEDKDFGRFVYAHGQSPVGVILLRFPTSARKEISDSVVRLVEERRDKLVGSFAVVKPGRIRIGRVPGAQVS